MYVPIPYNEAFLPEVDGHRVYYAEYGNPDGPVIVSLHGGPGARSKARHVEAFDIEKYRVVVFDQRGAGKSEPAGETAASTTELLIADIERLRTTLGLESWIVAGSSWGSTLALLYAEAHPERVTALLISAIWLGDQSDIDWSFMNPDGVRMFYSDIWSGALSKEAFAAFEAADEAAQRQLALEIINWEVNVLDLGDEVRLRTVDELTDDDFNAARIFLHYLAHDLFLAPDQIMSNINAITHIPTMIVHGRFDVLCPFKRAWELHQALPQSRIVTLPGTAHRHNGEAAIARYWAFDSFLKDIV